MGEGIFGMTGAIYYAVKDKKMFDNAMRSAQSLNEKMPDIDIVIYTDFDVHTDKVRIEKVKTPKNPLFGRIDCFLDAEFDRCVFLDADTYIYNSFYEAFDLLDNFDLAATLAPHYRTESYYDVPTCFPELNLGVVFWNRNVHTENLFYRWKELFEENCFIKRSQPHFRYVLYNSCIRFAVLPWEYNCRHNGPGYLFDEVKIFHRWNYRRLRKEAAVINSHICKRILTGKKMFVIDNNKNVSNTLEYRK